ncbi:hypothetical protein HNY73_017521 [Argiope bruennichi]|uniref:Uncharacterized protein n=1 Tax=Argiope bruennichi TaxID=94029 RepID=A0A8T0E9Y2_ARGBR|nr:hypothetical protein HNY73_017521 [Argiope bruennichi]
MWRSSLKSERMDLLFMCFAFIYFVGSCGETDFLADSALQPKMPLRSLQKVSPFLYSSKGSFNPLRKLLSLKGTDKSDDNQTAHTFPFTEKHGSKKKPSTDKKTGIFASQKTSIESTTPKMIIKFLTTKETITESTTEEITKATVTEFTSEETTKGTTHESYKQGDTTETTNHRIYTEGDTTETLPNLQQRRQLQKQLPNLQQRRQLQKQLPNLQQRRQLQKQLPPNLTEETTTKQLPQLQPRRQLQKQQPNLQQRRQQRKP